MNQKTFLNLKWKGDKKRRATTGGVVLIVFSIFITSLSSFDLSANKELGIAVFSTLLLFGLSIFALFEINLKSWILWFWISLMLLFFVWIIVGYVNGLFL